jgi:hypothetical protein
MQRRGRSRARTVAVGLGSAAPNQPESTMSKGMDQKKTEKKKPEKSLKEKRAAKKEKKGK